MVLVWPRMWPETTDTAPNSPMARALHKITPYSRPHLMLGKVTFQKVCQPVAPSTMAACSSSLPCACISGISSRAMKGKVTKMVASTMPGTAKDRKSTRLNSSHSQISYAVFCLKKKKKKSSHDPARVGGEHSERNHTHDTRR